MNIDSLLETGIGLIFVYFVLSMACVQIQEWIASKLKIRSQNMENAIRAILESGEISLALPTPWTALVTKPLKNLGQLFGKLLARFKKQGNVAPKAQTDSFTKNLYGHPLIQSLQESGGKPSYIPSSNFALAIFDIVMKAGTEASQIRYALEILNNKKEHLPELAGEEVKKKLDDLIAQAEDAQNADEQHRNAKLIQLHQVLEDFSDTYGQVKPVLEALLNANIPADGKTALEQMARGSAIMAVKHPAISQMINSIIVPIEANLEKGETMLALARTNAETLFNNTMERATGWYKRNTQWWLLIIASFLVVLVNIDSITIATALWRDPTLRQLVIAQAEQITTQVPPSQTTTPKDPFATAGELQEKLTATLKLPVGWEVITEPIQQSWLTGCSIVQGENQFNGFVINQRCVVIINLPKGWPDFLAKLVGWSISVIAAMQGAPFWFDALGKFINLRSAGKKPAEERSQAVGA